MEIKPDVVYRVRKGNTDGSVLIGDIVVLLSLDGSLNLFGEYGGWLEKDELTPEIMDFEADVIDDYELCSGSWMLGVRKKRDGFRY